MTLLESLEELSIRPRDDSSVRQSKHMHIWDECVFVYRTLVDCLFETSYPTLTLLSDYYTLSPVYSKSIPKILMPRRFAIIRPYLASLIYQNNPRPPLHEVVYSLIQPDKQTRASKWTITREEDSEFIKIKFKGYDETFYYLKSCRWIDLCQTIDECFNPRNWHYFTSGPLSLRRDDIVLDCGAAEGLFTFSIAPHVAHVYAIEPIPKWIPGLFRTFSTINNVDILNVGLGHKKDTLRMTDDEIFSRVSPEGALNIPIETIDALFFDKGHRVTLIKADVEGFEFQVLLGGENTIRSNRPRLSLTVYHDSNHCGQIMDFLKYIHHDYQFETRGIAANGNPVLLQAY